MIAGKFGRWIRRETAIVIAIKQTPFDEQLGAPRTLETERCKLFARAQTELMIQKPRVLQVEAILQIRTDVVSERSSAVTLADVQIKLHRELPVQPLATHALQQEIDFAKRTFSRAQWDVRRDHPRERAMRQEVFEQRFGVEAEPRQRRFVNLRVKRRGVAIERMEPSQRGFAFYLRCGGKRERRARARRAQQVRREQQPRKIPYGRIVERRDLVRDRHGPSAACSDLR